jgi:hypothetical protein
MLDEWFSFFCYYYISSMTGTQNSSKKSDTVHQNAIPIKRILGWDIARTHSDMCSDWIVAAAAIQ